MAANDISYDFLQQLTATVIQFNVVITKLDAISLSADNNDVFTIASKVGDQFVSKNITYKNFLDTTQEQIRKTPTADVYGEWTFGNKSVNDEANANRLLQGTNAIRNAWNNYDNSNTPDAKYCAVNIEFFKESAIKAIYDLSNYIYKDPHVPSHIGEVIYSYNLSTESAVKKIYGDNTSWENTSIAGKYILGNGNINELNTTEKYGVVSNNETVPTGEYTVSLEGAGFPEHTHPFKASADKSMQKWRYGTGMDGVALEAGHCWVDWAQCKNVKHQSHRDRNHGHWQVKKGTLSTSAVSITMWKNNVSTKSLIQKTYGTDTVQISNIVYTEDGTEVTSTKAHNNMPPSIILYCWRRVS